MLKWNAQPLKEINGIRFGMPRTLVRELFDGEYREFKKNRFSKNTTDDFGICHVFYNLEDKCEAVEVFIGCEIFVDGKMFFPVKIESMKNLIKDFEEEYGSYISKSQSIGIYAPNGMPESILFGAVGYYD